MKGNKKILVAAILLLLIVVSYTTYAVYRTAVDGSAKVTAATWQIEFSDGVNELEDNFELTFGVSDCVNNNHVQNGVIAPGASCSKTITLDASGSQVDVSYSVRANSANITATKNNSPVTTTGANAFSASVTDNGNGTILYTANPQTATLTVVLTWGGLDDEQSENEMNEADTALNGATITVPLTLVAKQVPVSGQS